MGHERVNPSRSSRDDGLDDHARCCDSAFESRWQRRAMFQSTQHLDAVHGVVVKINVVDVEVLADRELG